MNTKAAEFVQDWLGMILRDGGVVLPLRAYFDESQSEDPQVFCVAGYLFTKESAEAMEQPWRLILAEYGLPFFHMVDCAHGNKTCAHLSKDKREALQTRLFDLLKARMTCGFAVTFDMACEQELAKIKWPDGGDLTPYSACCYFVLHLVGRWAQKYEKTGDRIVYAFEAGASGEKRANELMHRTFKIDVGGNRFRYAGHSYIPKGSYAGIECADALAWQGAKDIKSQANGRPRRKDLESLYQKPHHRFHIDRTTIGRLAEIVSLSVAMAEAD